MLYVKYTKDLCIVLIFIPAQAACHWLMVLPNNTTELTCHHFLTHASRKVTVLVCLCLFVCYLVVCLFVCMFVCLFVCLFCLFGFQLFVCLFVCFLAVCLFVFLAVCLSIRQLFGCLFRRFLIKTHFISSVKKQHLAFAIHLSSNIRHCKNGK